MVDTMEPGTALAAGRYRIEGLLGSGGMAQVYRAYDVQLARPVAIKTMRPELVLDQGFPARFRREAQAMAGLGHPHVVTVHDTGQEPRTAGPAMQYFVMELVDGESLADRLRAAGTLPVQEALRIADQVLSALAVSHARDLVHRDIKPANILLDQRGTAKVADFGIVRAASGAGTALTATSMMIGTPQYMSPEQVQAGSQIDGRSDLYAVGVLLFEMLSGRVPFDGDDGFAIAYRHVTEPPPSLATSGVFGLPQLEVVLARALAKIPGERYPDADAMREALASGLSPHAAAAPAPPGVVPAPRPEVAVPDRPEQPPPLPSAVRRRKGLLLAAVVGGLLVIGGAALGTYQLLGREDAFPQAEHRLVLPPKVLDGEFTRSAIGYTREREAKGELGNTAQDVKYTQANYMPKEAGSEERLSVLGVYGRFKTPSKYRELRLKNPVTGPWRIVVPPRDFTPSGASDKIDCEALHAELGGISIVCAWADGNTNGEVTLGTRGNTTPSSAEIADVAKKTDRMLNQIRNPIP